MRLSLARDAVEDLRRLYRRSVIGFGEAHADAYYSRLNDALLKVAEFPNAYPERPSLDGVRVKPFEAHHILYRVRRDDVFILRVLHGRQEISRYLK